MITWDNFQSEHDDVEKLIYPFKIGDEYDKGEVNEVNSQIHAFQGTLLTFNKCDDDHVDFDDLTLPKPAHF